MVGITKEQMKTIPKSILCIERTSDLDELRSLYSIADYFVNPAYEDNYPTTNIEAIACGTPVVTFDTGGSPESAKMYGWSVQKKDMDVLLTALEKVQAINKLTIDIDYKHTVRKYVELY